MCTTRWQKVHVHLRPCASAARSIRISKRLALGSLVGLGLQLTSGSAEAGWDGPAQFLKSRQLANSDKLTAPFAVAAARLQEAQGLVKGDAPNFDDALTLVRRASCNCYSFEALAGDSIETKASLITQNLKLADPCTFRIIVKNTTIFMDSADPLRVAAYDSLDSLIRSFSLLDDTIMQAGEWDAENQADVAPLLAKTLQALNDLEDTVSRCIAQVL